MHAVAVAWYYLLWKSGRIPGQLETKASTPPRFVTFSLFLFFPLSLQSLESELAVTGNGTEISDFLLYLCSDAMLTRRGGWELSSSASFCAALLLLHVAVVLPGVVSSQSLKNSKLTATSLWLTLSVAQAILSRSNKFDASLFPILTVEDLVAQVKPAKLWLNIQHDIFYRQLNLDMRRYLLYLSKHNIPSYVSSPEVGFLSSIVGRFRKSKAKLIFCFLGEDTIEPSTNVIYGSLLKNLTFVKTFASGILIPKYYIWPVTSSGYVESYTSVVMDAHREGLEVFASEFANDVLFSYNYSYDPLAEVLSFIDNGIFSVDGGCDRLPHNRIRGHRLQVTWHSDVNVSNPVEIEVGKLGYSLSCSRIILFLGNLAKRCYSHVNMSNSDHDGADYIDRPVQGTKDGILMCMSSINLMEATTVTTSPFSSLSPDKDLSGILIGIENAAFLAEKLGYSVTDGVMRALQDSGYGNQTGQEVMILSKNSSVLIKFRQQTKYELLYMVDESTSDMVNSSIMDIKQFAHMIAISKQSVYPVSQQFMTGQTKLVQKLQSAGFAVYVYLFRNEFV
ncbi:Autophagy protein 16 (ATG16) [Musa troglodytarum]|uniref:glycerophosphodiester phosphodiesterase n=1 Tax=Musa troglodytarum TaxID=320322 RepID=A0A9E7HVT2_9LILI|nr:Autophagy protein 16 (ATG16) [Musa troglodytarum]